MMADRPSRETASRYGMPNPRRVSIARPASVSTMTTMLSPLLPTQTRFPSGLVAMPSTNFATGMTRFASRFATSSRLIDPSTMFVVNSSSPAADIANICDARPFVGTVPMTRPSRKSTSTTARLTSDVTARLVSPGKNAIPCGRRYSPRSIVRATVSRERSMTVMLLPGRSRVP